MASAETSQLLPTSFPALDSAPAIGGNFGDLSFLGKYQDPFRIFVLRLRYYVPIFGWLPRYKVENLLGDLVAGLTVSFLIIPQALSYAQGLVLVPPIFGLYTAAISTFCYAILGTSRQLSIGPEALVSIMVGASVREFNQWKGVLSNLELEPINPYQNVRETALLCLLIGFFTFILGFFRLGFLDSILSRALLRGFILAVVMVVIVDMCDPLLGLVSTVRECSSIINGTILVTTRTLLEGLENPSQELRSPIQQFINIISNLDKVHGLTTILSACSISFLVGMKYVKKAFPSRKYLSLIPEILVLVVLSTFFTWFYRWDCQGVDILGIVSIPSGDYPVSPLPTFSKIRHLFLAAVLISLIGFVESIAAAKTYSSKYDYVVSPNRELVAMGVVNIVSSAFGCFPAFGSLGRSSVNDAAGAKSQMAGFFTCMFVVITCVWLLPVFEYLPKAVCSSIIVVAVLKLIELDDVYFMLQVHAWKDLALLMLTFLSTILISIETGTLISVGVSLLLVVKHTTKTRIALLGYTTLFNPSTGQTKTKFKTIHGDSVERIRGCILVRLEESLFFGNVGQLKDRLKRIEMHGDLGVHPSEEPRISQPNSAHSSPTRESGSELKSVIFEMSGVASVDASAVHTLLEIIEGYHQRRITVGFVKLRANCVALFERAGICDLCRNHFFSKMMDAINSVGTISKSPVSFSPSRGNGHGTSIEAESSSASQNLQTSKRILQPFRKRYGLHDDTFLDILSDSD